MRERDFKRFLPIIKNQAGRFHNLAALDSLFSFEDLVSEGAVRFTILCQKYPDLPDAEFGRNLKKDLSDEFLNRYRTAATYIENKIIKSKHRAVEYTEVFTEDVSVGMSLSDAASVARDDWDMVDEHLSLSDEAREVADIIFNAPKELLEMAAGQVTSFTIQNFLNKKRGWDWVKIEKFWVSLKTAYAGK